MNVEIIRVSGEREQKEAVPSAAITLIGTWIGADTLDTVSLRDGRVMMVDDAGYETETIDHGGGRFELRPTRARKPVNPEATRLYHAVCVPGTTHEIVGDVCIVVDADFA